MSEVSFHWEKSPYTDTSDIIVPGRLCLLGFMVARGSKSTKPFLTFKHGDSGGDVALKVCDGTVTWPDPDPYKSVPGGGILFPDGLFLDTGNTGSTGTGSFFNAVTLVYQDG